MVDGYSNTTADEHDDIRYETFAHFDQANGPQPKATARYDC